MVRKVIRIFLDHAYQKKEAREACLKWSRPKPVPNIIFRHVRLKKKIRIIFKPVTK